MCNIMAAVGGIALLAMMGGNRNQSQPAPPPVAPIPKTNYGGAAGDQAGINQGLPNDGAGSPRTSSQIVRGKTQSQGGGGYRNPMAIPKSNQAPITRLPSIGSATQQKPVNYG